MFLRLQAYERPADLVTALALLAGPGARALAGGTAVVGPVDTATSLLVDLSGLDLRYIQPDGESALVGATTALDDLLRAPEVFLAGGGVLAQAVERFGPPTLLARATIGGVLAHPERTGELVAALLALDASVVLARLNVRGNMVVRRELDLDTYLAQRQEVLPGALIEAVRIPTVPVAAALERVARTPRDVPAVAVVAALHVENGCCRNVRLAATGLAPEPIRLTLAEQCVEGCSLTPDRLLQAAEQAMAEAIPPRDLRGGREYRRHLAGVLTRRALMSAAWPDGRM